MGRGFPGRTLAVLAGVLVLGATACGSSHRPSVAGGSIGYAAWSRDGRSIAWSEGIRGAGRARIWTAADDMSHARPVTPPLDALGQFGWLPGGRILYWANARLFVWRRGGDGRQISVSAGDGFALDADRRLIATGGPACSTGCDGGIVVLGLDGHVVRRITPHSQSVSPTFSPDGRRVAFARALCDQGGRCERPVGIWIASVATGRLRQVTRRGGSLSWSPDGARIAYVDTSYPITSLRVVSAAGGRACASSAALSTGSARRSGPRTRATSPSSWDVRHGC